MKKKVAIVTNSIPYYRFDAFNILQQRSDVSFKYFLSLPPDKSCIDAHQALDLHYSKGCNINFKSFHKNTNTEQVEILNIPFSLFFDIISYKPDLIISGEMGPKSILSFIASFFLKVPFVIWSEEITSSSLNISTIQKIFRKFLFRYSNAFLAWGEPAYKYILNNRVSDKKVYLCAQSVNNIYWRNSVQTFNKNLLINEFKIVGRVFALIGRLVKRKGFDKFIQAWSALPDEKKNNNTVLIAGNGEEEAYLRKLVEKHSVQNVFFLGAVTQSDLPKYYALADVFVFPSLIDVWGLVLNEALASGLPVLASKYAGSSQELIQNNNVGELIDPLNIAEFTEILSTWCDKDLSGYKEKAWGVIDKVNSNVTVNAFNKLISDFINFD